MSFQYPCHPMMDPKKRMHLSLRKTDGPRKSRCKVCGKLWTFTLSPNGPIITEGDTIMYDKDVKKAIKEIAKEAERTLERAMLETWENMSREEIVKFAQVSDSPGNLSANKLAKTILLAVAPERLNNEFNAESIKFNVTRVRNIQRKKARVK